MNENQKTLKADIASELTLARMRVHQLECQLRGYKAMSAAEFGRGLAFGLCAGSLATFIVMALRACF